MLGLVNNCQAEMSSYMPVTGGFIRMSGKWVNEALGFMIGWSECCCLCRLLDHTKILQTSSSTKPFLCPLRLLH
jgi:amino acid permease